jgi:hypothetical protein
MRRMKTGVENYRREEENAMKTKTNLKAGSEVRDSHDRYAN